MRLSSLASARPAYYDRNATVVTLSYYAAGLAPHASTTRWTTTIASGYKAFVENGLTTSRRQTAAGTLGDVLNQQKIVSTPTDTFIVPGYMYNNTVNYVERQIVSTQFTLVAGDTFYAVTSDNGTGGTVEYVNSARCLLFSA